MIDAFLKIDGIMGESTDAKHKDEIEVMSYTFGIETALTPGALTRGGGLAAGRAKPTEFAFTAGQSRASIPLMLSVFSGRRLKEALLSLRTAGEGATDYYTVKLTDVLVSSIHESGGTSSDMRPAQSVTLVFGKIEFSYAPQGGDGKPGQPLLGGWDVLANRPT
jgi:type VI secretion system secreted protein Hcp